MIETPSSSETAKVTKKNYVKLTSSALVMVISLVVTLAVLSLLFGHTGNTSTSNKVEAGIMDKFEQFVTNNILSELDGLVDVKRIFWLNDSDMVAPEPNASRFGESTDPSSLQWLLDEAAVILDGQTTLFTTETQILPGSKICYYLDETIFAIAWKEVYHNCVYTFSEVKIAHPSQFRRFLSEGQYGSGVLHTTSEMAASVNAVVASAGDYYGYRGVGVVVNNGIVHRERVNNLETCFIDDKGDMHFVSGSELAAPGSVAQFVEENNVRFSICFGPVLIRDGEYCAPPRYALGEITGQFSRSALCQLDTLHYAVVTANMEPGNRNVPTLRMFADTLYSLGIPTAYTLDGGQTATIVMNDKVFNTVSYGAEREISDIIYFATALPFGQAE